MSRRKKPENETIEQAAARHTLEAICNNATRSEKTSWNRMMDNMVTLIASIAPIEDKILDLQAKKAPIMDEVQALRAKMVKDCVHPYEQLVFKDDIVVECKFCNRSFRVVSQ